MGRSRRSPEQDSTPQDQSLVMSGSVLQPGSPDISVTTLDGSCVSSEAEQDGGSREATTSSMVLLGCTRCLMYVMLSKLDLKCPRCKSTALLDFFNLGNQAPERGLVDMPTNVSTRN